MKNAILTLIAALSLNASATSPVELPANGLAQLTLGGGMPVPGGIRSRRIVITHDGEVQLTETRFGMNFQNIFADVVRIQEVIGRMDAADLAELERAATGIHEGALTTPKGPRCADAPGYEYAVVKKGYLVPIMTRVSCLEAVLKDKGQRRIASAIIDYLDQWNSRH